MSEKKTNGSVAATFKNIYTVSVHWYIKDAFAGSCQQIFEKENFSEDILVAGCFYLNSKFISKSLSLLPSHHT